MSFIQRYWDRMQFLVDYRDGSVRERVLGTAGTVTGAPQNTRGMLRVSTSTQNVHYGAGYNISDWSQPFTFVFDFDYNRLASAALLLNKLSGVNYPGWYLYLSAGWLRFGLGKDGTHYMDFTLNTGLPLPDTHTRIVSIFSFDGTWTTTCMTGITNGVPQSTVSVTGAAPAVDLSNASNLVLSNTTYALKGGIRTIAKFSGTLTPTEQMNVYDELLNTRPVIKRASKHFSLPYPVKTPAEYAAEGCVMDADCGTGTSHRLVENVAAKVFVPIGSLSNKYPVASSKGGPFTGGLRFTGTTAGYAGQGLTCENLGNPALSECTVDCWALPTETGNIMVWSIDDALFWFSTSQVFFRHNNDLGQGSRYAPVGGLSRKWHHVVATFTNGETLPRLYVDGVSVAPTTTFPGGALDIKANSVCVIASYYGFIDAYTFDGDIARVKLLDHPLTPAEVRAEYLKGARKCLLDASVHRDGSCPVSLAFVGASNELAGWTVESGKWRITEDPPSGGQPGQRYIFGSSGLSVYARDDSAFGSWHLRMKKNLAAQPFLHFISSNKTGVAATGYYLMIDPSYIRLVRMPAGVTLISAGTTVSGNEYEFWVTRQFDGLFSLWVKGGAYTNWTLLGTATDTTVVTNSYCVWNRASGDDYLGGTIHYLGAINPYEAIKLGLIEGTIPEPFVFTTTDTTQSWTVSFASGAVYVFDWGDGVQTYHVGNGADQVITHTYAGAGTYTIKWYMHNPAALTKLIANNNSLSGSMPSFAACTNLQYFYLHSNAFTGALPSFATCTALSQFLVQYNQLSGQLPSFATCPVLGWCYFDHNLFTGELPAFAPTLLYIQASNNQFTGALPAFGNLRSLMAATIPFTDRVSYVPHLLCTYWDMDGDALTQAAVDQILVDFATNVAARPAAGTINLSGGTNAAPSAVGLAAKAAILAAKPGWTITNN